MPQIIPIKDLKDTAKVSEMCHKSADPIFVTKNGYGDMVLMSMETFEEMHQKEQLYRELEISENEIRGGKTRSAREALSDVRENYGL
ncbi:MAG: type II toxin-antitoxin system Phd/YefM family antitoxin [Lachnospiraceae bacterium]|nr:type II toxin-antitoxin system Phd/YefM family antitoxin [Lachnospiraceae bacterium]MDY6286439.1 type II toxin-antitoxin system Phd/YefM family antitoxin [Lachnospiraceae bacterium]MDY6306945.1 type II toxin-antitoxin system Phd/YefM family antitoxin [Oribacterium sp.]MDY6359573.1 type II toxin-antitoxin system Phd/YefM family antitoxin [Lachnospiraceae bacterium]